MTWHLDIENIAGIRHGTATLEPGLDAIRGTNWGGKSSFIRALETALGVASPLTEGADRGHVELDADGESVAVDLVRDGRTVRREGTPYLTGEYDRKRARLFACLDERNPVRRAVDAGENLEGVLLQPLAIQNIDEEIGSLKHEREQVEGEIARANEAADRIPSVRDEIEGLEAEIEDANERMSQLSTDDDGSDERDRLSGLRAERDQVASRIDRFENTVERTEATLADKQEELEALTVPEESSVEDDLADAREELQSVKNDLDLLQSLYSANQRVLEEDRLGLVTDVDHQLTDDTVACWVCDSETSRGEMDARVDALGERATELRSEIETHRDTVDRLEARAEEFDQTRRRERDLEEAIADHESTVADRRDRLAELRTRRDELDDEIEELSAEVSATTDELTDLESEVKYREMELEEYRDELATLETRADRADDLEAERERLSTEIADLRNRKAAVKRRTREAFDDAIGEIVPRFETGFETARLTPNFDLVVARNGREAQLSALSEGERELLGLVAALAGHAAFEVGDTVPCLLVDGVSSLADENLHTLVEYLRDRTTYIVFTVHPEYTAFEGNEITIDDWTVVSDERSATAPQ
ncbi:archaea-specific SMC-related protein [Halococcus agarilyticus]|uniref:archaea-specific SMC-related protein n=1 Tax=Halococcus agarilyticus TaxID=1232219 RepID=UPI000677E70E|nr:archaea-specific SMC-related protein [Halococcus agarilyticus]